MSAAAEFERISDTLAGTEWTAAREDVSGVPAAVLVRRVWRGSGRPSWTPSGASSGVDSGVESITDPEIGDVEKSQKRRPTSANVFRPKCPMGVQNGLAGRPGHRASSEAASAPTQMGDLSTVKAMATGLYAPIIAFDTEFTYDETETVRRIDSYQFSTLDQDDLDWRFDVVLLPLVEERLSVEACLAVVVRESGLWQAAGLPDPRGIPRRDFWDADGGYRASVEKLYKGHSVPVVLAGHFLSADLTAFARPVSRRSDARYQDILRRVTSASGGLVSLKPVHMIARPGSHGSWERWLPLSITVRDTMGQSAPGQKSLAALGEVVGVPKLSVGDAISDMTAMRRDDLVQFLDYGANDSVIVLEYLSALWGLNAVPPVTLSGGGAHALREGVKDYLGLQSNAEFMARFQGLVRIDEGEEPSDDGLSYYAVRSLTPVDGDANQVHSAGKQAFHGGWNSALQVGFFDETTYDHDIQSAYPSAMASIVDIDYEDGCIEEVIKGRELTSDDFPLGPVTPMLAYASWEFPEGVEPCLPVRVGQSIIYPRTSVGAGASQGVGMDGIDFRSFEGAWVCGPELALALALGARVDVQIGYRLKVLMVDGEPSRSMRHAVRQMVADRKTAKGLWGKGSLAELVIKVATNSCYGKLAQDVAERSGWNAWAEEMESIGGSSVTSPYHAAMITSLVRALLLGMANEVDLISVTTDGFITRESDVERYGCFDVAGIFRDARQALVEDPTVWEVKHQQDDLVNLTTRGNVASQLGGVLARAGVKTPDHLRPAVNASEEEREWLELEERRWFRSLAVSREGKIVNSYRAFPSFRELSRSVNRVDFRPVDRAPEISLDFDTKRRPLMETLREDVVDGHEVVGFETVPWDTVTDYLRAREIARHIAAMRPGTTGEDRPTGCLRTRVQWETWQRRYESSVGRRIRKANSALLTEIVAAHKEGLVTIPVLASKVPVEQKLAWLSSLGYGDFSRAQWDHMSKRARRARVLADLDLGALAEVVDGLPQW